jgi:hypothetical protein
MPPARHRVQTHPNNVVMADDDPRAALILQEAVRALDQQSDSLNELRSRTGIVLTASSVSSAFLGATALEHGGFSVLNILAFVVFLCSILLCLGVLLPADDWEFLYSTETLEKSYIGESVELAQMQRSMAAGYSESWKENNGRIKPLYVLLRFAIVAVGVDVLLWLVAIRVK